MSKADANQKPPSSPGVSQKKPLSQDVSLGIPSDLNTKDLSQYPLFQGVLSRLFWGFVMHRMTRAGRWFFFLSLALMMVGGISLEIQAYIPFVYTASFWLFAILIAIFSAPRVRLSFIHPDRIRVGQELSVEISVTQIGKRPGFEYNVLPIRLPPSVDLVERWGVSVGTLQPSETRRVRMRLLCKKRGRYVLKGYKVETDFPLGLLNAYRNFKEDRNLLVYPDYTPLTRMDLPTGRRFQPGGVAMASKLGDSYEYLGNRDFREGDNIRDIDWRATARMGGMPIVREYREEYFQRIGVVLDTFVPKTLPKKAAAARRASFEQAVSLAAAVGDYMAGQEYIVDLFAAGPNLYHLTAGRSLAFLEQILDILACVEESPTEPMASVAPEIQEYIDRLTTVVCIFLSWDEARDSFVQTLRQSGSGVRVLVVSDDTHVVPPDVTVLDSRSFAGGVSAL